MKKTEIDRKELGIGDRFNFVGASESYKYIGLKYLIKNIPLN
jgi:hypothetical protein